MSLIYFLLIALYRMFDRKEIIQWRKIIQIKSPDILSSADTFKTGNRRSVELFEQFFEFKRRLQQVDLQQFICFVPAITKPMNKPNRQDLHNTNNKISASVFSFRHIRSINISLIREVNLRFHNKIFLMASRKRKQMPQKDSQFQHLNIKDNSAFFTASPSAMIYYEPRDMLLNNRKTLNDGNQQVDSQQVNKFNQIYGQNLTPQKISAGGNLDHRLESTASKANKIDSESCSDKMPRKSKAIHKWSYFSEGGRFGKINFRFNRSAKV